MGVHTLVHQQCDLLFAFASVCLFIFLVLTSSRLFSFNFVLTFFPFMFLFLSDPLRLLSFSPPSLSFSGSEQIQIHNLFFSAMSFNKVDTHNFMIFAIFNL